MGVAHALKFTLQTIAYRVGSYKDKSIGMANKKSAIQTSSGCFITQRRTLAPIDPVP
jgi:hypothetical protein